MPQTRKLIRDAARTLLSDAATGFNPRLASLAAAYGITTVTVDWTAPSQSFIQTFLDPGAVDISLFLRVPVGVALYTSASAESSQDEGRTKFSAFSGAISLHTDFYLQFEAGREPDDTESLADAIEDAVLQVLHQTNAAWPASVIYNGDFSSTRESIIQVGDGYTQRIPFTFLFEVHL